MFLKTISYNLIGYFYNISHMTTSTYQGLLKDLSNYKFIYKVLRN